MLKIVLYLFAVIRSSECLPVDLTKFADTLRVGLRLASTFLNSDRDDIVFSILGKFDGGLHSKSDPRNAIPFFLKLMGLNATKVEDFAFDGFIFLAHLIGQILTNDGSAKRKQKSSFSSDTKEFSPFEYIMKQPKVRSLLTQMNDPNMVEFILNESERKLSGFAAEDVECIPLLLCKMDPFVKGMQRSLGFFLEQGKIDSGTCYSNMTTRHDDCQEKVRWGKSNNEDRMFFFLPSLSEVISHGDKCDERYSKCVY